MEIKVLILLAQGNVQVPTLFYAFVGFCKNNYTDTYSRFY